jgi:hypothetical protein
MGGTLGVDPVGLSLAAAEASITLDSEGPNQTLLPYVVSAPPVWPQRGGLEVIPRNAPLNLNFTPGDATVPTGIVLYAYSSVLNATVQVQCLAAAGAASFTIPANVLANLPVSYRVLDGSYNTLQIGTLGLAKIKSFANGLATSGLLFHSSWLGHSKQLTILASACVVDPASLTVDVTPTYRCKNLGQSAALDFALVQGLISAFEKEYDADVRLPTQFETAALAATVPRLIALDAKSDNRVVSINLSTFATTNSASFPSLRGQVFGLRPSASGPAKAAWVPTFKTGGGIQLAAVNLDSGALVAQIPIPITGAGGMPEGWSSATPARRCLS